MKRIADFWFLKADIISKLHPSLWSWFKSYLFETYTSSFFQVLGKIEPVKVNISTVFQTVIDISESSHIIELKFKIHLEWYEYRAKGRANKL